MGVIKMIKSRKPSDEYMDYSDFFQRFFINDFDHIMSEFNEK